MRSDGAVFECKELEVFTVFLFYTFWGISALVLFQNTEKSIKLHLIFKIHILAATSKQFLANWNDSLGMTVRRNKVLLVENLVKNPFLPPLNGLKVGKIGWIRMNRAWYVQNSWMRIERPKQIISIIIARFS